VLETLDLEPYAPILVFILLAISLSFILLIVSFLRGVSHPDKAKLAPYECGFEAFDVSASKGYNSTTRMPFDVHFYLVAILFIIFDLEIAFLFPWAVTFSQLTPLAFGSMMGFLSILTLGLIYEWRKGALDW
jgi:NADH-quinone oxidoreductase subunit A